MGCSAVLFLAVVLGQRLLIQLLNHQSLPSRKYISHTRSLSPALSTAHSLELPTERHPGLLQKSHEVRVTQGLTYGCAHGLTTWCQYKLRDLVRTHLISCTQHGHTLELLFCLCSEAFYYWSITLER